MNWGNIGDECWSAGCQETATHIVTTRIVSEDWEQSTAYCLKDALYFAAWLPYCYPGEYELISILPPSSELFDRDN